MNLSDQYHDEHGRPLVSVPEPSQASRGALEAWQRSVIARAAARQEVRANTKELGPLHAQPAKTNAQRRATLGAALGVGQATAAAPAPAGPPEQPTADPALPLATVDPDTARHFADAEKSARRRAASLKSAATVRAQRLQREHDASVEELMEKRLDAIGKAVVQKQHDDEAEAAELAAHPGILTARGILAHARANNAEAELYRFAHISRAPRQPSQWPAEFRRLAEIEINNVIAHRQTQKTKGPKK